MPFNEEHGFGDKTIDTMPYKSKYTKQSQIDIKILKTVIIMFACIIIYQALI